MAENLIVIARVRVRPEQREAFIAAALVCIAATRQEAGCLAYDMHESVSAPAHFVFVETWKTRAALDAHMKTPHLGAFLAAAQPCLSEAPSIEAISPASIERLM